MNQVLEICKPTHYLSYKPDVFFLKFILAKTGTLTCMCDVQNDRCHRICFPVSNIQNWEMS